MSEEGQQPRLIKALLVDLMPIDLHSYARRSGQKITAVRKQVHDKAIPTLKLGKSSKVYVNIAAMVLESLKEEGFEMRLVEMTDGEPDKYWVVRNIEDEQ